MSATTLHSHYGSRLTHSRAAAEKVIAGLNFERSNRELAEHWLSLWDGDALPPRAKFNPGKLKSFLPGIMLFDVVPDHSVKVRLAGTGYRFVLERDPTGEDWIAPDANGVSTVLGRVNFKAEDFRHIKSMPQVLGDPLDVILVPFTN